MPTIKLHFRLEEPALFTALIGEPNSSVSYDHIPGSVIRGTLIGAAMRQGIQLDPANHDVQRLFFSDATRYLNAYVINPLTEQRALPVPKSWAREKHPVDVTIPGKVFDLAVAELETQTKSVGGYVTMEGVSATVLELRRTLNIHTQRPRRGALARAGDAGTVYRYDAIAREQTFVGLVLCESMQDAEWLTSLLDAVPEIMLGGARSAGYGRVSVTAVPDMKDSWETTSHPSDLTIITLLSDAIVRDRHGQDQSSLPVLLEALNRSGSALTEEDVKISFLGTTMVGGFNRKWGLPLPQTQAISMGSVIVVKSGVVIENDVLSRWQWEGIGERRGEGFGRLAVNWQAQPTYILTENITDKDASRSVVQELTGTAAELWNRIQAYQTEQANASRLAEVFQDSAERIQGAIPRTQLARLRNAISDELRREKPSRALVSLYLSDIEGKYADRELQAARVGGVSLKDWLKRQMESNENDLMLLKRIDAILESAQKRSKRRSRRSAER